MRDLKRKGFKLYERTKLETRAMIDNLKDLQYEMKSEQDEAMRNQDKVMQSRIAENLVITQEEFLLKTEMAADEIFEANHKKVFDGLKKATTRLNAISEEHDTQTANYNKLFASNEAAVVLHNEVKRIFEEESKNFFSERLKWKTDA